MNQNQDQAQTSHSRIVIEFDGFAVKMDVEGGVTAAQMFAAAGVLTGEANYLMDAGRAQRIASSIEVARGMPGAPLQRRKGN